MSDPATDVRNQFYGVGPQDQCTLYDGFAPARPGVFGSFRVPDLRAVIFTFAHDLLRGLVPKDRAGQLDVTVPWGFRDSVNLQHLLAVQNNWLLLAICDELKIDVSKLPGRVAGAHTDAVKYEATGITVYA